MPNWIPITAANVLDALQAPELDALRTAALGDTQGDPIGAAILGVVPRIRGYVASRAGNKLDQDDTLIPPELFQDGVWLVIQSLKVRLGDATKLSADQAALIKRAEDDLQKVATGVLRVSLPQNPQTTSTIQSGGGAEIVSSRARSFGDMSGNTGPTQLNTLAGLGITDGVSKNDHWLNPDWLVSFSWLKLIDRPTNVANSGLADAVSTAAMSAAIAAALISPAFTGVPTAPTAAGGNNTTQVATTAFVRGEVASLIATAPSALDTLNELAAALGNDPSFATTVTNALALKAPLASPALTGVPTAPTAAAGTATTQIATTAFVGTAVSNLVNAAPGALDTLAELAAALGNDASFATTVTNALALKATIANPNHTGAMTLAYGTAATAVSPLTITQTWNGGGIVFPGVVLDFTDTLSSANSLMLDMRVGGASKAAFDKAGNLTLFGATGLTINNASGANFQAVLGGISLSTATASGISFWTNNVSRWSVNGTSGHLIPSASATYDLGSSVSASRVRNGYFSSSVKITGAASIFELWNTDGAVSTTNFEKAVFDWVTSANVLSIGTVKGGTGNTRNVDLFAAGTLTLRAAAAGGSNIGMIVDANGNLCPMTSGSNTATGRFICLQSGAGAPTGAPAPTQGVAGYIDTTNKKFYAYIGGTWYSTQLV